MAKVYRVSNMYGSRYLNTKSEAKSCRPGGEPAESWETVDAAEECNRLAAELEQQEHESNYLARLLRDVMNEESVVPTAEGNLSLRHGTMAGRLAAGHLEHYQMPAADAADRDGQRGYGI